MRHARTAPPGGHFDFRSPQTRYTQVIVGAHRASMAARQLGLCPWCRKPLDNPLDGNLTHIDHVQPVGLKGMSESGGLRRTHYNSRPAWRRHGDNLQLLHASCNLDRGDTPF